MRRQTKRLESLSARARVEVYCERWRGAVARRSHACKLGGQRRGGFAGTRTRVAHRRMSPASENSHCAYISVVQSSYTCVMGLCPHVRWGCTRMHPDIVAQVMQDWPRAASASNVLAPDI